MSREPVRGAQAVFNAETQRAMMPWAAYIRRENIHSSLRSRTSKALLVWFGDELQ